MLPFVVFAFYLFIFFVFYLLFEQTLTPALVVLCSIKYWAIGSPKRNWKQCLWNTLRNNKEYYGIFEKGLRQLLSFQTYAPNAEDCHSGLRGRRPWDCPLFQWRIQRVPGNRMSSKNAKHSLKDLNFEKLWSFCPMFVLVSVHLPESERSIVNNGNHWLQAGSMSMSDSLS